MQGDAVTLLQELLNDAGYTLQVTGIFDAATDKTVRLFQLQNNLVSDGIVYTKTWTRLLQFHSTDLSKMEKKFLKESDIQKLANELNLEVAVVKAVNKIESSGRGFLTDGRPKILFEGHIFWNQLKKRKIDPADYVAGNENVLYPKWTKKYYVGGKTEYERLYKAASILNTTACTEAAYASASWGLFQIMGFHYEKLGFATVSDFVSEMKRSEGSQLKIFGKFLRINNLVKYLQNKQWAEFAKRYNGPLYAQNKYDIKLAQSYDAFSR